MKVHWRPPLPPAPPPPKPPTPLTAALQAEELFETALAHQTRLRKLYGARKRGDAEDEDETEDHDRRSPRNGRLDVLA